MFTIYKYVQQIVNIFSLKIFVMISGIKNTSVCIFIKYDKHSKSAVSKANVSVGLSNSLLSSLYFSYSGIYYIL